MIIELLEHYIYNNNVKCGGECHLVKIQKELIELLSLPTIFLLFCKKITILVKVKGVL